MYSLGRLGQWAGVTIVTLLASGCAMSVSSFTKTGADFTQYRTYDWAADRPFETGDPRLDNNPFFLERLRAAVEKELAAKGMERATAGEPALRVHYHASVTQQLDLSNVDREQRSECESCEPYVYDEGSLVIDLVDTRTNTLVWRGWAEGSIDGIVERQDRMEETVDRAVARIFESLPRGL
jgi:hypothetical protein